MNKRKYNRTRVRWRATLSSIFLALLVLSSPAITSARQISSDVESQINDTPFYDPDSTINECGTASVGSGSSVSPSQAQIQNAKTIIGIAKTDGLNETAAQIGLMVGLDESTLTDLANQNVPISENNPQKQGDGSNGTSLGVFQQQITENWSTISTSIDSSAAVNQLMTVSYEAEAFFGSPPGSNAPAQLSKGLQNVHDWQSLTTWAAAQAVQASGTPSGSNYEKEVPAAQALLNKYWSSSGPVPLPVSITAATGNNNGSVTNINCGSVSTGQYANPFRDVTQLRSERIDQGVDYAGEGPVYALGDGTIVNIQNGGPLGWCWGTPPTENRLNGPCAFIVDHLSDGPAKGLYSYMAENCQQKVTVGEQVTANTVICDMSYPQGTGIETGWANPPGSGNALAYSEFNGSNSTEDGINYNQLLVTLGNQSGVIVTGAGAPGPLSPGLPQWCQGKDYECK